MAAWDGWSLASCSSVVQAGLPLMFLAQFGPRIIPKNDQKWCMSMSIVIVLLVIMSLFFFLAISRFNQNPRLQDLRWTYTAAPSRSGSQHTLWPFRWPPLWDHPGWHRRHLHWSRSRESGYPPWEWTVEANGSRTQKWLDWSKQRISRKGNLNSQAAERSEQTKKWLSAWALVENRMRFTAELTKLWSSRRLSHWFLLVPAQNLWNLVENLGDFGFLQENRKRYFCAMAKFQLKTDCFFSCPPVFAAVRSSISWFLLMLFDSVECQAFRVGGRSPPLIKKKTKKSLVLRLRV